MTKRLVNFRGTKDFAYVKNKPKTGGPGKTDEKGGIAWSSCQFVSKNSGGKGGDGKGGGWRNLQQPKGVQYSFSPATNMAAWRFGLLSASVLTQIMEKYPSTSKGIMWMVEINKPFSPKNIAWVKISRPCNPFAVDDGWKDKPRKYTSYKVPSWKDLVGGMASPRELAQYMNSFSPMPAYNEFWNEAAYIIYRAYKGAKMTWDDPEQRRILDLIK